MPASPPAPRSPLRELALAGLLALGATHARAEEAPPSPRLTIERVFGGAPIAAPLPDWRWRPGHTELVRVVTREKKDLLVVMDARQGIERVLHDLSKLEAEVPGERGAGERGLGRGWPERLLWRRDGLAFAALVKGERVWVDLKTGATRLLTRGLPERSDVQLSPDGTHLSFEAGNALYVVPVDGGAPRIVCADERPDVLVGTFDWLIPEELGLDHASWWSHDGSKLVVLTLDQKDVPTYAIPKSLTLEGASETMRYPYAGQKNPKPGLRVVSAAGDRPPVELAIDDEYVARVAWAPGIGEDQGDRVHVATLDRPQRRLTLRSFNVTTGAATVVLADADGCWQEPPTLQRINYRDVLWRACLEGEERLWSASSDAHGAPSERTALTPPGFVVHDVVHVRGIPANQVLYTGHTALGRRRELWRVTWGRHGRSRHVGGQEPQRERLLADVSQDLSVTVSDNEELMLVRRSSALEPTVLEVRDLAQGRLVRTLGDARSAAWSALDLPAIEEGETDLGSGAKSLWRLFKPRSVPEGTRLPLVLIVYGGPGARTVEDRFGGGLWPALLVQEGFAVLQVDGRGTGGQGAAFERLLKGKLGDVDHAGLPQTIADVARTRPWLDAKRVGIWGWSYGGTMACDALLRRPDVFTCAVAIAPVTDWRLYDTIYTERYMGLPDAEKAAYDATSSVLRAGDEKARGTACPLLLLHGLADDNVHPVNSLRLVETLLRNDRTGFDWHLYPDRGHGLGDAQRDVHRRSLDWLRKHLR